VSELHNPYVGLRPFFLQDSLHFFGRDAQTAELLAVLRQHRFLGVVGSSGSGKSSLVRAGLLPALFGGFLVGDRDRWQIVQIKPGDTPMRNLAAGLLAASSETPPTTAEIATLEAAIRDEQADAVVAFVRARLTSRQSLFLLVDQFEEIFAFRRAGDEQREEASDFVALLMALADEHLDVPVFVALTMRTDFLGDCDLFYGLPEIMNRGQYLVPRLTRQQLRLAIEGPAMLTGARFAPQLIDLLLNQLGDREDRLPVIQHALLRTWDAWHAAGAAGPIEVHHFEQAGGLEHALNIDAEAALAEVKAARPTLDDRAVARVFKALIDTDLAHRAVRRPSRVNELMAASGADRAAVDTIIRCFSHRNRNFLYADGWPSATDPRVDISHESLIRQWARLRDWVAEEREMRDQFTALVARARSWKKYGVVLQRNELKSAEAWWSSAEPSAAWARRYALADDDFAVARQHLTASTSARRRTKIRWAGAAALIVAAVAATLTYQQRSQATRTTDTELLRDMENQATSLLERDPESAIVAGLIAAHAHGRLYPGIELPVTLETILLRGWQESALIKTQQLPFGGDADYAVLSPDARVVMIGSETVDNGDSGVKVYTLGTGEILGSTATPSLTDGCSALSPDGRHINATLSEISVRWSVNTGDVSEVAEVSRESRRRWQHCAYSPDGAALAVITSAADGSDWVLTLGNVTPERITTARVIRLAPKAEHAAALRFSQDGKSIAVALAAKKVVTALITKVETALIVIDASTGKQSRRFTTENSVSDLALSRHGVLATVEDAYTYGLFLRDIAGDTFAAMLPNSGSDDDYGGLAFSPDGDRLAAVNGDTASLWEVATGLDIGSFKGHPRGILAVGFDAQGQLVTVGQDADVRYWRAGSRELRAIQADQNLRTAVMSPEGTTVIAADNNGAVTGSNVEHPDQPLAVVFDSPVVFQLALSPDGRTLAELAPSFEGGAGAEQLVIRIRDAQSGRVLTEVEGGSLTARLAFSPDGQRLAIADTARVRVWTVPPSGTQPFRLSGPVEVSAKAGSVLEFLAAVFSLDEGSRQLATINGRGVYLWDAATGACQGRIQADSPVSALAYVPGGEHIATGDGLGRVRFWPIAAALRVGCAHATLKVPPTNTLQEHRAPVRAITFVGDGSRFATASDDRTAKVWDTKTGRVLMTLRHGRAVTRAVFSLDGRRLMTTVEDQGAKVWEIPTRDEIFLAARARLTRDCLSKEERQRFFPGKPLEDPPCMPAGR